MTEEQDEVAVLVRLARESVPVATERLARVRTSVHDAWRDEYVARHARQVRTRRWVIAGGLVTATACALIAIALWRPAGTSVSGSAPVLVAHIDRVTGEATAASAPATAGAAVASGSTVTTATGTLAMTLASGVQLRLDVSSTVRADSVSDVTLERGALYVDSAGAHPTEPGASPISIHTTAGIVRDVGTQFEVRFTSAGLRIRVRDGRVRVSRANGEDVRATAGEELVSRSDGSIDRRSIGRTGIQWVWAERAAPTFSVEGRTLGAFLDWVSREGAWTVTFADSNLAAPARAFVLSASRVCSRASRPLKRLTWSCRRAACAIASIASEW
jgi:ferric-dicitrate binding protein FerR (iron transport regulator)